MTHHRDRTCSLARMATRYGRCEGWPIQGDHIIERQQLRTAQSQARLRRVDHPLLHVALATLIADQDNIWDLCPRHHHQKTMKFIQIPRRILPASVERFARRFEVEYILNRHFGPLADDTDELQRSLDQAAALPPLNLPPMG